MDSLTPDVTALVSLLQTTPSPQSLLKHSDNHGLPNYWWDAVGHHLPPYSDQEVEAVLEAKKLDPPACDLVWEGLHLGNKAAAEDTKFLREKGITHVLNLASDTKLRFFVTPDKKALAQAGIELLEMQLRDRVDEDISGSFVRSGVWLRRALLGGGRVMVNCWQGASRSATIVLAYMMQHSDISLVEAVKLVKTRRDIRPNNSFLAQLQVLESHLRHGMFNNLVMLDSEEGQRLVEQSREQGTCKLGQIEQFFAKQTHNTFCGIQSACIALNTIGCRPAGREHGSVYREGDWWDYSPLHGVEEEVVRREGLTLAQAGLVIRQVAGDQLEEVQETRTDQASVEMFRRVVETAMRSGRQEVIVNYHMEILGQSRGLGGHLSPLAAYIPSQDLVLLMDVWPQTKECWVPLTSLWAAMDTEDKASNPPTKRGFILLSR